MVDYTQFRTSLNNKLVGSNTKHSMFYYGHNIIESVDGTVYIDYQSSDASCLEEAISFIDQQRMQPQIDKAVQQQFYKSLSENKIAQIIRKHRGNDIKITNTLIEQLVESASSKHFTLDPVVNDLIQLNKLDTVIEGKRVFQLEDQTQIAIDESSYQALQKLFGQHEDVVQYMNESYNNFSLVVAQIKE